MAWVSPEIRFYSWSFFFFSSRRRHTRLQGDWSSDVCSSDLHDALVEVFAGEHGVERHDSAVRGSEHDAEQVELALSAREHIALNCERLDKQTTDQHRLHAQPVRSNSEEQSATESREPFDAVDTHGRHHR